VRTSWRSGSRRLHLPRLSAHPGQAQRLQREARHPVLEDDASNANGDVVSRRMLYPRLERERPHVPRVGQHAQRALVGAKQVRRGGGRRGRGFGAPRLGTPAEERQQQEADKRAFHAPIVRLALPTVSRDYALRGCRRPTLRLPPQQVAKRLLVGSQKQAVLGVRAGGFRLDECSAGACRRTAGRERVTGSSTGACCARRAVSTNPRLGSGCRFRTFPRAAGPRPTGPGGVLEDPVELVWSTPIVALCHGVERRSGPPSRAGSLRPAGHEADVARSLEEAEALAILLLISWAARRVADGDARAVATPRGPSQRLLDEGIGGGAADARRGQVVDAHEEDADARHGGDRLDVLRSPPSAR